MADALSPDIAIRPWIPGDAEPILRAIVSVIDYGIMLTDLDRVTLAANRRFGEIFGVDISNFVSGDVQHVRKSVRNRIPDYHSWVAGLDHVYSDPMIEESDVLRLVNPHCVTLRRTGPVLAADGSPLGRYWTFLDITEQHRSDEVQEEMREITLIADVDPRKVYEQIVDHVGQFFDSASILSIRSEDYMVFQSIGGTNEQLKALKGNPITESYCQFTLDPPRPLLIQNALADPVHAETTPAKYGLTRYAGVPITQPDGTAIGTLCILDSRSEEVITEEEMQLLLVSAMRISYEIEREMQIKELEGDLAHAQTKLIQSEKLAITGTLAASIAHDIRNIVSAMMLDLDASIDGQSEQGELFRTHLRRFSVLSSRLLSYARPKSSAHHAVSIKDSLDRVHELIAPHLGITQVSWENRIPLTLPNILGDPMQLDHVFMNLALNAIEASEKGSSIAIEADLSERVIVRFRDSGVGMDPDFLQHIFEPFSSSRASGFGLGLYSCQQIVKSFGGTISVNSAPGCTEFRLEFLRA